MVKLFEIIVFFLVIYYFFEFFTNIFKVLLFRNI